MTQHTLSQKVTDRRVREVQAIARRHPAKGTGLTSEELIRERRAETKRELLDITPRDQHGGGRRSR